MRSRTLKGFLLILAVSFLAHTGSAAEPVLPKVENSLPLEIFARYNDSFDKLREDIWGKVGHLLRADPRAANFQLADVRVEGGRVRVETKTGCYSSGGLGPKIRFRGDFDVQVDCHVEFLPGVEDMDQDIAFYGSNRTRDLRDDEIETIYIGIQKPGRAPAVLYCGYQEKGRPQPASANRVPDRFQGTLRIVRIGNQVTLLHRTTGQEEWQKAGTFARSPYETILAFKASNFAVRRTMIGAKAPFVAWFDNFRINAAQEILEPASVQDMALLRIEKSLPPEKLARFNDTFDTLREDLWERAAFIYKAADKADFKQADLLAQGGRLNVVTKTGTFSRSGLGSKFTFKGDFDIQIDAQVQFMEDVHDMDQVVGLYALDKTNELEDDKVEFVAIGVGKEARKPAILYSAYQEKGKWNGLNTLDINQFRGTFRVIRIGKIFTTLYKNEGETEWRRVGTVSRTTHEIVIVFIAQNYLAARTSVAATRTFTASFDNFRINAAQNIQESEI